MSALADLKLRLRETAELHLRIDAMRRLRGNAPGTVEPYPVRGAWFWRYVFVPLYRAIPWTVKRRAMDVAQMTARGWTPPARTTSTPWQPPKDRIPSGGAPARNGAPVGAAGDKDG